MSGFYSTRRTADLIAQIDARGTAAVLSVTAEAEDQDAKLSVGDLSAMGCAAALPPSRSPRSLPKLTSSQSTEQNSEHLAELKTSANNSYALNRARCKAVYTGSIPFIASLLACKGCATTARFAR